MPRPTKTPKARGKSVPPPTPTVTPDPVVDAGKVVAVNATVPGVTTWEGMKVYLAPLASIVPYARNSKTHPEEQIAKLMGSLAEFGWVRPILVDRLDNLSIVAGHGTVMAASRLWADGKEIKSAVDGSIIPNRMVPFIVASNLTDAQRRAYVIADNKLGEDAPWDREMLALELDDLKEVDFPLELTGFTLDELADLSAGWTSDINLRERDGAHTNGIVATIHVDLSPDDVQRAQTVISAALETAGVKCSLR